MRTIESRSFPYLIELGIVLLGMWLLSGCEKAQSAPPPPQVTVAPAVSRVVAQARALADRDVATITEDELKVAFR